MNNIIDIEDLVMIDKAKTKSSDTVIRWADEQMDTRTLET